MRASQLQINYYVDKWTSTYSKEEYLAKVIVDEIARAINIQEIYEDEFGPQPKRPKHDSSRPEGA